MIIGRSRFNIYLLSLMALLAAGCQTGKHKSDKKYATLAIHLEASADHLDFSRRVPIYRARPVEVMVDRDAFLGESQVQKARVIEDKGGWALQIIFERRGAWLLEQYTTTNPGKHLAIFCEFGEKNKTQPRWLAAPVIGKRISDGTLTFTPDATREEAEEIALGLNNVAKKIAEKSTQW